MFYFVLFTYQIDSTSRMPKMKPTMDNWIEALEKNMEILKIMVEDWEERMNQQMKEMKLMFTSFMKR